MFALGSAYSTKAQQTTEQIGHNIVKNPNGLTGGKPVFYLRGWPRIWTRGHRKTNLGGGQSGSRTRDLWIACPTRVDHSATRHPLPWKKKTMQKILMLVIWSYLNWLLGGFCKDNCPYLVVIYKEIFDHIGMTLQGQKLSECVHVKFAFENFCRSSKRDHKGDICH